MWAITQEDFDEGQPGTSAARRGAIPKASTPVRGRVKDASRQEEVRAGRVEDPLRGFVLGMQKGDQVALGRLYDATAGRLYGVIQRIVRQPELAEEVLADVFHQAWRDCTRHDPRRGQVIAWLLIMSRTRALDALRRRDEAVSHPDPAALGEPLLSQERLDGPDELLNMLQAQGELALALRELSALQRQLIALAFFKGLSHAEIAEHCGMPLGSVKTHLRRALQTLKQAMPTLSQFL